VVSKKKETTNHYSQRHMRTEPLIQGVTTNSLLKTYVRPPP
jgi:hypothetical protein